MSFKLLIIRFSSIGDIVLTTPVIRCLYNQHSDIEIHYVTKNSFAHILEANPYISKVYSFKSSLNEVIPALKEEKYDYIVDLHKNLRSNLVLLNLLRPSSSFNKLNLEKWILVKFKINKLPDVHIVDRYLAAANKLNIVNDNRGLDFFIPEESLVDVKELFPQFSNGYVGFVIGGNHGTKLLPVHKIIEVCKGINLPVVILGGTEDFVRGQQIQEVLGANAVNACGKYKLMQSASIVQQARCIITNDTGLMHIAAAFNKPIVSVWGNTVPEFGMFPYLKENVPQLKAEVNNLKCRPCSKIGYKKCPLEHFKCMNDQDSNRIIDFVKQVTKSISE